ncbi:unnamed protein product [Durusdinium trenchii]|uniref:Dynein axonemal light chain 1 n=1 Tax=Durusdinium trenchii TaxID=1381693 RepID=A0ABP0RQ30_9DINO
MISLPALKNIEVLSLGRNLIKKISGLEEIGSTLKELWISYNQISTLDGLAPCVKLTTLFISNNKIKDWPELDKLQANQDLVNVLFYGNPIYEGLSKKQARPKVLEHLPKIATLDGELLTGDDDDGAGAPPRDRTGEKRRRGRKLRSEEWPAYGIWTPDVELSVTLRTSVISLPCYDDDGVYLGPAIYGTAKTFAAPAARSMRKRLRRGALKGKTEDLDGYPEREDPGPGDDAPVARLGRSSVPKEGLSRRSSPPALAVEPVFGNAPQAGISLAQNQVELPSLCRPRDINSRAASPLSPLGTLEPPRGQRMLQHLGASVVGEEVPAPQKYESESEEDDPSCPSITPGSPAKRALPEAAHAPRTVAQLEQLMLEWSETPADCKDGDFCYAKALTPYTLIPVRRPNEQDKTWVVAGRSGLMFCSETGIEDWVTYKDFFAERELYRTMKRQRWAKQFQIEKNFHRWRENARRAGFALARDAVADQLFHLKPITQDALLWLHRFCCEKFERLSPLDAEAFGHQPRLLAEYGAIHRMGCERVLALVTTLDHQLENGLRKWCSKMLRPHLDAEREAAPKPPNLAIAAAEVTDVMQSLVPLIEPSKEEVALGFPPTTVAGRTRLQHVCYSIWTFIRLCSFMVEGHLRNLARQEFQRFAAALLSEPREFLRSEQWRNSRTPDVPMRRRVSGQRRALRDLVFQLELTTGVDLRRWPRQARRAAADPRVPAPPAPRLAATPNAEEVIGWVLQAMNSNINTLQSLRMPSCTASLLLYRQVATQNGLADSEETPHWPCYELSKDILNEEGAQENVLAVLERLKEAFQVMDSLEQKLQGLVGRYCDSMTFSPVPSDALQDLASQMINLGEMKKQLLDVQESYPVNGILLLDCLTLQKDLNHGWSDRLDELIRKSQEEIEAASRPVQQWTSEHQGTIQALPPTDIENFLQYLLRVQRIQLDFPQHQKQVQQMQHLELLLHQIGGVLDSFYTDMIVHSKERTTDFKRELTKSLERIEVSSKRFIEALQQQKPTILQKLQLFIQSLQDPALQTLQSDTFGELEADDMAPSKALLMAEHRGEELKFSFQDQQETQYILKTEALLTKKSQELQQLEELVRNWTEKLRCLGVEDATCEEKFTEAQSLLDPLAELWSAAAEFLEVLRFCGEADLWSFDQELCCSKCKDMSEQLEDMLPICMCVELHTRCELLLEILNLAQIFKSQELQEVHWQQLDAMVDKWNLKILQNLRTRLNNKSVMLQVSVRSG